MSERILLLSLHDVTPRHAERLAQAEALFRRVGAASVTYLLVPRYHGGWPIDDNPGFSQWCRARRTFAVHWCLHGYHHQETPGGHDHFPSIGNWVKRRFLTEGEGEFLAIAPAEAADRIDRGRISYRSCLGADPSGFVAPAWLFNRALIPSLAERGFAWTEDHRRIHRLRDRTPIDAPVITWASRSRARRWASTWVSSRLLRRWRESPILRIAVHPCDFDYPSVAENVERTIVAAMRERRLATYENVLS